MDLEAGIEIAKLLVTTIEALVVEIAKAKQAIDNGTAQLKSAIAEAQKLSDQLAADRKSADDDLDKKFDKGAS